MQEVLLAIINFIASLKDAFIAISSALVGFFLNRIGEYLKRRKETQQILAVVNSEIYTLSFALIHPEPRKSNIHLERLYGNNLVNSKIGSLNINHDQLQLILEIYKILDGIKLLQLEIKDGKTNTSVLTRLPELRELSSHCLSLIDDYQKKYDKENRLIK